MAFDLNGNMTARPQSGTITYDREDQPTQFRGVGGVDNSLLQFGYGFDGLPSWRQGKNNAIPQRQFVYDGLTPVMELDSAGNVVAVNTVGPDGVLSRTTGTFSAPAAAISAGDPQPTPGTDNPPLPPSDTAKASVPSVNASNPAVNASTPLVPLATTTTTVFYLPDERGNTAMRLDRNGAILSAHVTDAFGATKTRDYVGSSADDPFAGFGGSLGYMRESGLDLYRCGLRFYDVANARWLTRDPIGYDGGQNLYGYVAGNPVMGADPLGTDDDELSDADILHIGGGRNFRPGMHAGTCRSNTAKQMMRDLNQTLILTVASGTAAGVGQMAGPVAEGLATESSIVGGKSILSGITNAWNRFLRSLKSPFDIFGTVKNLHSPETIPQLMQDMRTPGAFEYGELRGQIAGYHVDGKYFVTEGHHRVTAAIKVWIADGNAEPLSNLIKNGVWSSGRAPGTSYRFPLK